MQDLQLSASSSSSGQVELTGEKDGSLSLAAFFKPRRDNTHVVVIKGALPKRFSLDGELLLSGWDSSTIRYVAIGWRTLSGVYENVRIKHTFEDEWVPFRICASSIIFGLMNKQKSSEDYTEIRIVLSGRCTERGVLRLRNLRLQDSQSSVTYTDPEYGFSELKFAGERFTVPDDIRQILLDQSGINESIIDEYWEKQFSRILKLGNARLEDFLERGSLWMTDLTPVEDKGFRPNLDALDSTTARYRWHSLNHVAALLELGQKCEAAIIAGRVYFEDWVQHNYVGEPSDPMYAWYDHGTAERLVVALRLMQFGINRCWDAAFFRMIFNFVYRHAELLASPAFYAYNQNVAVHNHAIFQDHALLLFCRMMPWVPDADIWYREGTRRVIWQFQNLFTEDGASIENSSGYHVATAGLLRNTRIVAESDGLKRLSCRAEAHTLALTYPDGTVPAFGDTYYTRNSDRIRFSEGAPTVKRVEGDLFVSSGGYVFVDWNTSEGLRCSLRLIASDITETHKHNDSLSFTLWVDGLEWISDPGFYSYSTEPKAAWGRSTAAHNRPSIKTTGNQLDFGVTEIITAEREGSRTFRILCKCKHSPKVEFQRELKIDDECIQVIDSVSGKFGLTASFVLGDCIEIRKAGENEGWLLESPLSNSEVLFKVPLEAAKVWPANLFPGFRKSLETQSIELTCAEKCILLRRSEDNSAEY